MRLISTIFERLPMVWFLLGLLFNAAGLYLGFEYSLAFGYLIIGWFCCAYGLAIFVFRIQERPRTTAATRLSPNFVSAGSTVVMPVSEVAERVQGSESPDAGKPAPGSDGTATPRPSE